MTSQAQNQDESAKPPVRSLTDSVWFWVYLFGTGGLVALYITGPKYRQRQTQLERQFSARQSGGQAVSGVDGPVDPTNSEQIISLDPLVVLMGTLLAIGWFGLWYHRFRKRKQTDNS